MTICAHPYSYAEFGYNITYLVLLLLQIALLVFAVKRESDDVFFSALLLGGICCVIITIFEDCAPLQLEKALFILFMPCLFDIVNLLVFIFRYRLRYVIESRLPWRFIFWASLAIDLYLLIHLFYIRK